MNKRGHLCTHGDVTTPTIMIIIIRHTLQQSKQVLVNTILIEGRKSFQGYTINAERTCVSLFRSPSPDNVDAETNRLELRCYSVRANINRALD